MFEDSRAESGTDRMALVIGDMEEWLDDHGYEVASAQRSGRLTFDEPGYGVVAENDAVTVGYLSEVGGTPTFHTIMLEELWAMDEDEWEAQIEELTEEG